MRMMSRIKTNVEYIKPMFTMMIAEAKEGGRGEVRSALMLSHHVNHSGPWLHLRVVITQ